MTEFQRELYELVEASFRRQGPTIKEELSNKKNMYPTHLDCIRHMELISQKTPFSSSKFLKICIFTTRGTNSVEHHHHGIVELMWNNCGINVEQLWN